MDLLKIVDSWNVLENVPGIDPWNVVENVPGINRWNVLENASIRSRDRASIQTSRNGVLKNFLMTMYVTFAVSNNYLGVNFDYVIYYNYCLLLIGHLMFPPCQVVILHISVVDHSPEWVIYMQQLLLYILLPWQYHFSNILLYCRVYC